VFGPGSFVVSMAQPKQALVRWMLGRTFYPDNTYTRDNEGNPIRPYDMSTDTFGEFMGVQSDPVGEPVTTELVKLTAHLPLAGTVADSGAGGYRLSGALNDSYRAVNLLLDRGATVHRVGRSAASAKPAPSTELRAGDFVITGAAAPVLSEIAKQTGVSFTAASNVPDGAYLIRKPRVALFQRYRGGNMDEGWTRLMFEQFAVPYTTIRDADLKAGALETKFDVIVLPNDSIAAMTGERPAGSGQTPPPADITPPEYQSGFGAEGVKALDAFVQKGGTLVTFGQAGDLPMQRFGLPLRNVVANLPSKEFWSPGSTLRVRYHTSNPVAYGMPEEGLALFMAGSQVYEITSMDQGQNVDIIATYVDRDILQSGWLLGEQVIAKKAAAVTVRHGDGKVILLGFRPQHRDQTHGTFKLVFNALLNAPPAPTATTTQ
jgi:hypothetical protein